MKKDQLMKDASENRFKKYLFNETTIVVSIIAAVFWTINWITSPITAVQKDIALIQKDIQIINTNHLTHLQNYAEEIRVLKQKEADEDKKIELLYQMTVDNQAMLKTHLGIDN